MTGKDSSSSQTRWNAPERTDLPCLSLTEPVTQAVRSDDIEYFPRDVVVLFDVELGKFLAEPVRVELREQRLEVLDMEGTTVLRGIAAVFCESDLDLVAGKHGRVVRRVAARQHSEAEHGFVEGQGGSKVPHGEMHVVALVAPCFLENCLHYGFLSSVQLLVGCPRACVP